MQVFALTMNFYCVQSIVEKLVQYGIENNRAENKKHGFDFDTDLFTVNQWKENFLLRHELHCFFTHFLFVLKKWKIVGQLKQVLIYSEVFSLFPGADNYLFQLEKPELNKSNSKVARNSVTQRIRQTAMTKSTKHCWRNAVTFLFQFEIELLFICLNCGSPRLKNCA